jgi:conjugative relaxase-like TrwC/TraI family protein
MGKMRDGAQWLSNHYAANDYYCEGEHVVGSWVGRGAEALGILGQSIEPQNAAFLRIFSGRTPTEEKLKQRNSDIIGYDFQCSAQKSVSIMAILGADERLFEAHRAAVKQSYQALETLACVQGRDEQKNKRRSTTGVLCSARFDHDTSRALDPHIHTHFATANFSITPEGRRYALETHDMVKAIRYCGKIYQSAVRQKVEELGYRTRDKFNDRGQIEGFEIDGISDDLCEKYSQRRGEIEERIADFRAEHGREPTTAEIHVIAKETRTSKLIDISTEAVRAQQLARASAEELAQIDRVRAQAYARQETQATKTDASELVSLIRDHLAERRATFGEHDLIAEALNRGMGKVSLSELEVAIQVDPELVRLDQQKNAIAVLTNQTNLRLEQESVAFVNAGIESAVAINTSYVPFPELVERDGRWLKMQSDGVIHDYTEQRSAVEAMLRSTDQVFALRGVAGAGKTTALKEFHAGVNAAGKSHVLLAPTTKAVEALKREIPEGQVQTVEAFLLVSQKGPQPQDAVITVDEWGLLSNRSGHELLRIAKEQGALVRFVGDTRQHVAVEAGDFGRTLEKHSNLRSVSISKISRQRDPEYRAAVMEMASSNVAAGLARLDQKGWIHEEKSGYLIEAAKRYLELSGCGKKLVTERGEPHVLAVGPTHAEIRAFTADVRAAMRAHGALSGPVIKRRAFIAHDTTRAMRRDSDTYTPGMAVTLVSEKTKVRGLSAREVYTVKQNQTQSALKKKDFVTLIDGHGKDHKINVHANGEKLELGAIGEIELQAGDRLWFRANSSGVTNGTLASFAGTDEQGRLVTTGGFVVPEDYLKIAHGYATTSHSSQGLTANFAVVFGASFDQKAIYVSHSRARERVDTFVPSKEAFLTRAERAQGDRLGVLEAIADAKRKNDGLNSFEAARLIESEPEKKPMDKIQVRQIDDPERDRAQREEPEHQYLTVPYAEREEAKAAGAKWDWREKLWYIGSEGTRAGLAKWLPENAAATAPQASPREEFAELLRELGGDLTGEHPIMDGRPHRMATLDDDRGEKSMFYVGHSDGRPAGYAKNNRTGEEQRWKASAVTMTREQFTAIVPGKAAEREADRMALYERTADRLSAHIEAYPALSPDHDYLKAKRISPEPGVFETPRGSMAVPAFDADGKLWSVQYVNSDGSKRFARESRKEGCFHVVGSTDPVGDLNNADTIVVAEGYATAATLKSLHAETGDGRVAFVAAFDAGNVPHVARALRERHLSAAMVIAADNDKAREGQEPGRNPGLIKGQQAAEGAGAVLMAPSFSEEELEAGFSDWNDLASHDEVRKGLVAKELENALVKALERARHSDPVLNVDGNTELENASEREDEEPSADQNVSSGVTVQKKQEIFFSIGKNGPEEYLRTANGRFVPREGGEKLRILNEDHQGATPEKNIADNTAPPEEARIDSGDAEQEPVWELSSGELQNKQSPPAPLERDPQLDWDFRIGKNGAIEHFRSSDGRVALRETGDKIHILDQDHDAMALALERAIERFGTHLNFDANQAGARTLVDIVVTHDLAVTFTDDQLNAQIQLRRTQNGLDRGRSIATSEPAQTPAQKRSAGASGSTPERKTALQPDGQVASQQTGEVFVDCGAARFNFDEKNDLNYFVRTITPQGEQRIYWGKDLPRALEEAGAKVGESITATRVASKPVTVQEIQEQPDGSRQTVRIDAKRGQWQVDNHGVNREALIKAYDVLVKSPEDRKTLERTAPLLVAARDQAVVELKREKLAAELNQRNLRNQIVRRR